MLSSPLNAAWMAAGSSTRHRAASSGYKVRRGFSGAPVFDELGNTIWGMVVTVETDPGIYVAFSIPAEDLREA